MGVRDSSLNMNSWRVKSRVLSLSAGNLSISTRAAVGSLCAMQSRDGIQIDSAPCIPADLTFMYNTGVLMPYRFGLHLLSLSQSRSSLKSMHGIYEALSAGHAVFYPLMCHTLKRRRNDLKFARSSRLVVVCFLQLTCTSLGEYDVMGVTGKCDCHMWHN